MRRVVLSDGVVSLAPYDAADVPTIVELDADPDIQRWFDWPLTPGAADPGTLLARRGSALATVGDKQASWDLGTELAFIIHSAASGAGMGWVDIQPEAAGRRHNVGYGILPGFRRQRVASRAVVLVSDFAFEELGWPYVEIRAAADN